MRRMIAVFSAIFFVFVIACQGQDNAIVTTKSPKWSGNYSAAFGDRYAGTTVCAVFANQTVFQHSLTIARASEKTNVAVTIWNSAGITPSTWFV